jgi:hypothetical protein
MYQKLKLTHACPASLPSPQVGFPAAIFWEYILPNHPNITEQVAEGLQLAGLNNATSATGAALIGGVVLWNIISALAPWSATFSEDNLRVGR